MNKFFGTGGNVTIDSRGLALRIARIAKSKKAQKVVVLDVRGISTFCDYFVISSGTSLRQINALAGIIETDLNKDGITSLSQISPHDESGWVVLDYVSVVVHLFYKSVREYYCLERLWADAKKVRVPAK